MRNTGTLMVASLKIEVLREELYALAVSLRVGVSDRQALLLGRLGGAVG